MIRNNRHPYLSGVTKQITDQMTTMDTGIYLLEKTYSRGLDTKFKVDSTVMIIAEVDDYSELIQMVGRSSRSRGLCESYLFSVGSENSFQLIQRL